MPSAEVGAAGLRHLRQPLERIAGQPGVVRRAQLPRPARAAPTVETVARLCPRLACWAAASASVITAQAVVQDRGRPVRVGHRDSLPASRRLRPWLPRSAARLRRGDLAAPRASSRSSRASARPGRRADRVGLGDQGRGGRDSHRWPATAAPSAYQQDGSWSSTPASRASRTCRTSNARQASLSHSALAAAWASQPQQWGSSAAMSALAKAFTARRNAGAAAAGPSVTSSARPSSARSTGCGSVPRRRRARAARQTSSRSLAPPAARRTAPPSRRSGRPGGPGRRRAARAAWPP